MTQLVYAILLQAKKTAGAKWLHTDTDENFDTYNRCCHAIERLLLRH